MNNNLPRPALLLLALAWLAFMATMVATSLPTLPAVGP